MQADATFLIVVGKSTSRIKRLIFTFAIFILECQFVSVYLPSRSADASLLMKENYFFKLPNPISIGNIKHTPV